MRLGVISDTHGMLRPEVLEVFENVDHILHGAMWGRGKSCSICRPWRP